MCSLARPGGVGQIYLAQDLKLLIGISAEDPGRPPHLLNKEIVAVFSIVGSMFYDIKIIICNTYKIVSGKLF